MLRSTPLKQQVPGVPRSLRLNVSLLHATLQYAESLPAEDSISPVYSSAMEPCHA